MAAPRFDGHIPGRHTITAVGQGGFRFADMSHRGSLLVLPTGITAMTTPEPFRHEIRLIEPVLALAGSVDILLLGTGTTPLPLPTELRQLLGAARISVDVMTTAAAASTCNLLMEERRRVAALLVAIP